MFVTWVKFQGETSLLCYARLKKIGYNMLLLCLALITLIICFVIVADIDVIVIELDCFNS